MTKLAEVVTLYETNARSISDMLRQAADGIDSEASEDCSPTVAVVAVQLTADGTIQVYGWGDTTDIHAMGVLHCGLQQIGSIVLDTGE